MSAFRVAQFFKIRNVVHANGEEGGEAEELLGARRKVFGVARRDTGENREVVDYPC